MLKIWEPLANFAKGSHKTGVELTINHAAQLLDTRMEGTGSGSNLSACRTSEQTCLKKGR